MQKKILVAMSGGVDSSVCALLLKKEGYDVYGMMLRLYSDNSLPLGEAQNEKDAKAVCDSLSIPFFVADYHTEFEKEVIGEFIAAYERGETPNPCVVCNRKVKFEFMLREADRLGIEKIATGHYAICEEENGKTVIRKGKDMRKDQSYMLAGLTSEQISRVIFPLGELTKDEIRAIAYESALPVAAKKDSQDICFIPDGDYISFIEKTTEKNYPEGDFVDLSGNVLGKHKGLVRYTTGQRKGLGLALPAPLYVLSKDVENNRVILGTNNQLFERECIVRNVNIISSEMPSEPFSAEVKVRYSHSASPATVYPLGDTTVRVLFDTPQRAITKGQTAAFYKGDILIGGGFIE